MNGPQDLGGMMGFGPINPEQDEPLFHADWEPRVLGLVLCCAGLGYWGIDEGRHARETIAPAQYLSFSYYKIWFTALERLLVHYGEVTPDELASGQMKQPGLRSDHKVLAEAIPVILAAGGPANRESEAAAKFQVGDRVRTINMHPTGHTRLPRYARAKTGVVTAVHEPHVFPDAAAHKQGDQPQWLYTVMFTGTELWGKDADPTLEVRVDAWEPYLANA